MAALILLLRSELRIVLRRDAEVLEEEGVDVRRLLDGLRGAARAVAGLRVNANEDGVVAGLRRLQSGRVLERVRGHDAVVVVGCCDERRRILRAVMYVVD